MLSDWRAEGWPGPLAHENERILSWALAVEAIGLPAADGAYQFPVAEGNEGLVLVRQMRALGFLRKRARDAAMGQAESERKAVSRGD